MEELKYPTIDETEIHSPDPDTHNNNDINQNVIITQNDLSNFGDLTIKTLNCMSINNPYGDIHTSSNININGELFVFEKATFENDVSLSSENFTTVVKGNLDARVLNVDTIHSTSLNTSYLKVITSNMEDVTISGNLTILGEIKYNEVENDNKNFHIDPTSILTKDSSTDSHIIFGADESEGSWRITIIKGAMHIQQHNGTEWITKTHFQ